MRLVVLLVIAGTISNVVSKSTVEFEMPTGCHGDMRYDFVNPTIIRTATELGCGRKCGKILSCLAFNSRKDGTSTVCELGGHDTAAGNCSKLDTSDGSTYMEKTQLCGNGGYWDEAVRACAGCADGYTGIYCERLFRGCHEAGGTYGVRTVQTTETNEPMDVLCMSHYTAILTRGYTVSPLDFNRTWNEYKHGFGDMSGDFFLGLDLIHEITSTLTCPSFLIFTSPQTDNAQYTYWKIADEDQSYEMNYNMYRVSSSLDDALVDSKSTKFSTHDTGDESRCAAETGSGWWFNANCSGVNMHKPKTGGIVLQWPVNGSQIDIQKFRVMLYCN